MEMAGHGRPLALVLAAALATAVALPAGAAHGAAPEIPALGLPADVRIEGLVALSLRARDPDDAVLGVEVDFGEGEEHVAEFACRRPSSGRAPASGPFAPGTEVGIQVPYTFLRAGLHVVTVEVTSGGCEGPTETVRRTLLVTVLPVSVPVPASPPTTPQVPLPALPGITSGACPDAFLRPAAGNGARLATATLCLVNVERARHRLRLLQANRNLAAAAAVHTRDMVRRGYFAHAAPGGPRLSTRVRRARYVSGFRIWNVGENIAAGTGYLSTPVQTVAAWMKSPGHRANMLEPRFRDVGVGAVAGFPGRPNRGGTYTADFGRRSTKR